MPGPDRDLDSRCKLKKQGRKLESLDFEYLLNTETLRHIAQGAIYLEDHERYLQIPIQVQERTSPRAQRRS